MEKRGVYSGHIATENFEVLAKAVAAGRGSPEHPITILPAEAELAESWTPDTIKGYAQQVVYEIFGV